MQGGYFCAFIDSLLLVVRGLLSRCALLAFERLKFFSRATMTDSALRDADKTEEQHAAANSSSIAVEASQDFAADINGEKTGTAADARDMHRLGKTQELKRNFRSLSILGLSSVVMATWVAFLSSSNFSMINGGLAGTIWDFVAIWILTFPVTLSLAEMASMAPVSLSRCNGPRKRRTDRP